ncbi:MAG: PEGA domain-containing protein, partial [Betaproteobacteria bacterium]|nr:PEGA domain-containing protein [Betaproteobacteria bacterium]
VAEVIRPLPAAGRIVLDVPDGAAIVVLGSPKEALDIAERSQLGAADLPLCIGVNHGPVTPVADDFRGQGLAGDGLVTAMTLSQAAEPGRLLASRPFHEALEAIAPGRADELKHAGVFTDAGLRTHEFYALDLRAARAHQRRRIALGVFTVIGILAAGFGARAMRSVAVSAPAPRAIAPAPLPAPEPPPPPLAPAIIEFAIKPKGDVYIDGVRKGTTPPLARLEVSPGSHRIKVVHGKFAPVYLQVNLESSEVVIVKHAFVRKRRPGTARRLMNDLRRQLGF